MLTTRGVTRLSHLRSCCLPFADSQAMLIVIPTSRKSLPTVCRLWGVGGIRAAKSTRALSFFLSRSLLVPVCYYHHSRPTTTTHPADPYPWTRTRTRTWPHRYGVAQVWVRVQAGIPMGYPCYSLPGSARVRVTRAGHRYGYYWGMGTGWDSKTRALTRTPAIPVPSINAILPACTLQPAPPPSTQTSCRQHISSCFLRRNSKVPRSFGIRTYRIPDDTTGPPCKLPARCRTRTRHHIATNTFAFSGTCRIPHATFDNTHYVAVQHADGCHQQAPSSTYTTPVNAGVARMHTEDTRTKREGKEEEREEEGMILSDATPDTSHSRATTPPSPISTRSPSTSIVCDTPPATTSASISTLIPMVPAGKPCMGAGTGLSLLYPPKTHTRQSGYGFLPGAESMMSSCRFRHWCFSIIGAWYLSTVRGTRNQQYEHCHKNAQKPHHESTIGCWNRMGVEIGALGGVGGVGDDNGKTSGENAKMGHVWGFMSLWGWSNS
ncbi:uncharacterized protein HD556DRAFT_1306028 [Suillus plorans]|uniref:Uncharacterized protein n=1 Tax=Suillus plorans TaxID=116603 RepID=A0A9P7J106_9AGAM|nr:uncharacterized protein HD556DRAFT_1306028 [Suillus plorans]KAG1798577.1 hypothetical protein HD556DRAFT_1306028 [Suillus plorans]